MSEVTTRGRRHKALKADWRYGYARGIGLEAHLPTAHVLTTRPLDSNQKNTNTAILRWLSIGEDENSNVTGQVSSGSNRQPRGAGEDYGQIEGGKRQRYRDSAKVPSHIQESYRRQVDVTTKTNRPPYR